MIDGKLLVEKLLKYAEAFLHLNPRDEIYMRNLLLREFKLDEPYKGEEDISFVETLDVPDTLVSEIEQYAEENALAEEGEYNLYSTYIMGILSPLPSKVNEEFYRLKQTEGIEKACRYFYDLSVKKTRRLLLQPRPLSRAVILSAFFARKTKGIKVLLLTPREKISERFPSNSQANPGSFSIRLTRIITSI